MPRRAHNSSFPESILYKGNVFNSLSELYREASPAAVVTIATFTSRARGLQGKLKLTTEQIQDALNLSPNEYRMKFGARKTWIVIDGHSLDLQEVHRLSASKIDYRLAWQRVRALIRKSALDRGSLDDALSMQNPDWIAFYGGGRHRTFVYEGEIYPEFMGFRFHSIVAFLKKIRRYPERATIWSRLKNSWKIDDALSVPTSNESKRAGLIYQLLRLKTSQIYVGLTLSSLEQRWEFHIRAAKNGSKTKIAQAIREDGKDGFQCSILEAGISGPELLANREKFWVRKLDALGELGLNTAKPGGLGAARGKRIEVEGITYRSIAEASQIISDRSGLPIHVVRSRVIQKLPIPETIRKNSKHEDAGTNLFRRWLALVKRHPNKVVARWANNYDNFKMDVQPFDPAQRLIRLSEKRHWGPKNFEWVNTKVAIERKHGMQLTAFGITYPSIQAAAQHFGLGVSTFKDRIRRQGFTIEAALKEPLSETSFRKQSAPVVDGKTFRSKRQATLYLAASRGWTEDQAKYRLSIGKFN